MKALLAVLLLSFAGNRTLPAEIPAGWSTDYIETVAAAEAGQRPALIFFTASWCGPCKMMSRTTLADPAVRKIIAGVALVAVDIDEHPDLASNAGIDAVPTFVLLSSRADEVERATGFQASGDFTQWLANGISEAREAIARRTLSTKTMAEIDELLVTSGTNADHVAAQKLFDLCDERDASIVRVAAGRLKAIAGRDPMALVDGLNDPRLATRIQVANALQEAIGESFDVDPWSDAATREKKGRALRDALAKAPGAKGLK